MVTPGQLNRRAALFEQLAAMISAGVPLPKAMEMAARNRSVGASQRMVQAITGHLHEGHTFTDAMQLASGQKSGMNALLKPSKEYWLSDFDVALLSAGEVSGKLDSTFRLLSRFYAARAKLIRDTLTSLIIPIATFLLFLAIFPISYLQRFALGIVNNQPSECTPFLVEKVLAYGAFFGVVWLFMFSVQSNRAEGWRAIVEAIFDLVPMLRTAVKQLTVSRLAMALEALMSAGVPVVRSWELAAASCGSPKLRSAVIRWAPELETGITPAEMVAQIGYFPDMFAQLYHSGEISGKLDETLARLHTYFEDEGVRKLKAFSHILSFFIYFTVAGLVGYNIIHFWLQYYGNLLNSV